MTSPPPFDTEKWQTYEDSVAQHIRDILGEELDLWLDGEVERRKASPVDRQEEERWKTNAPIAEEKRLVVYAIFLLDFAPSGGLSEIQTQRQIAKGTQGTTGMTPRRRKDVRTREDHAASRVDGQT